MLALTAVQVAAVAAITEAIGVLVALVFAWRQVREMATTRRDQGRAYVTVYFDFPDDRRQFPDLVVRNTGDTAAYDVTVTFNPRLRSSLDESGYRIADLGMLTCGIATLPPKSSIASLFDTMLDRPKEWESRYTAVITYKDRHGETHSDQFILDLDVFRGVHWVDRRGLHDIHEQLKKLTQEVHHMRTGFGAPLPVVTEERTTYESRQAQRREERRAQHDPPARDPNDRTD